MQALAREDGRERGATGPHLKTRRVERPRLRPEIKPLQSKPMPGAKRVAVVESPTAWD
jgi:hypothetical protein